MLLDKLLINVEVHVEPFATCLLDTGWRLRLPGPPDVMFHFVLEGRGFLVGPGGQRHGLERFFLAIVPKGTPHSLECGAAIHAERAIGSPPSGDGVVDLVAGEGAPDLRIACGVVSVRYGDSLGLFQHLRDVLVADLSGFPQTRLAFETLLAEQSGPGPGSTTLTQALMSQCLVYLLRYLSGQGGDSLPWISGLLDPDLGRALDLILEKPDDHHTLDSLADAALKSRSTFSARFHEAFGVPPMQFLHDVRLRRRAELLQRNPALTVEHVARRVGFTSRSHFSQEFRARFGMSPAAFRHRSPTTSAAK